ncbi:MAG: hypothetical protein QOD03_544, partial [Verrucomicrobiota bacterium]
LVCPRDWLPTIRRHYERSSLVGVRGLFHVQRRAGVFFHRHETSARDGQLSLFLRRYRPNCAGALFRGIADLRRNRDGSSASGMALHGAAGPEIFPRARRRIACVYLDWGELASTEDEKTSRRSLRGKRATGRTRDSRQIFSHLACGRPNFERFYDGRPRCLCLACRQPL